MFTTEILAKEQEEGFSESTQPNRDSHFSVKKKSSMMPKLLLTFFIGFVAFKYYKTNISSDEILKHPPVVLTEQEKKNKLADYFEVKKEKIPSEKPVVTKQHKEIVKSSTLVQKKPEPKIKTSDLSLPKKEEKPKIKKHQKTEKEYLLDRKKILLSYFILEDTKLDLLGDIPILSIKGSAYQQGESIGNGFRIGEFEVLPGEKETILDIKVVIPVYDEKTDKLIRKIEIPVGKYYSITFYEGALQLSNIDTNRNSDIVLEGDKICSVLTLSKVKEEDNVEIYTVLTKSGKSISQVVPLDRVE